MAACVCARSCSVSVSVQTVSWLWGLWARVSFLQLLGLHFCDQSGWEVYLFISKHFVFSSVRFLRRGLCRLGLLLLALGLLRTSFRLGYSGAFVGCFKPFFLM